MKLISIPILCTTATEQLDVTQCVDVRYTICYNNNIFSKYFSVAVLSESHCIPCFMGKV